MAGSLAGPVGTVAGLSTGAALPSFALEYGNVLNEELQKTGAVTQEGMLASLNDPEFMARARERAVKRGVPIAAFDALSMGLAGKPFQLARKVGGGRIAGVGAEVGTQAVTAGAGEAAAPAVPLGFFFAGAPYSSSCSSSCTPLGLNLFFALIFAFISAVACGDFSAGLANSDCASF